MTYTCDSQPAYQRKLVLLLALLSALSRAGAVQSAEPRFIDHSLLVAPELPCTWPSHPFPRFAIIHSRTIGPDSASNIDTLRIDGNIVHADPARGEVDHHLGSGSGHPVGRRRYGTWPDRGCWIGSYLDV